MIYCFQAAYVQHFQYPVLFVTFVLILLPDNSRTERVISIVNVTLSVQNRIEHPT